MSISWSSLEKAVLCKLVDRMGPLDNNLAGTL